VSVENGHVSELQIRRFVDRFYGEVRADSELGPIFEARVGDRWEAHLDRMVDFWSSVLLASGRYRGNPLEKHATLSGLESRHYDRWLELFEQTLGEVLPGPLATDVLARARRMRVVLDVGAGGTGGDRQRASRERTYGRSDPDARPSA
jgi:hemoglobin